jgi:hypothetical protein
MWYNAHMSRATLANLPAALLGIVAGLLLWGFMLGMQVRRYEAGLWTVRFQRIFDCGLDYNGPPFASGAATIWLTCGNEEGGWQVWPP